MRRRISISLALAVLVGSLTAGSALASKPTNTCPSSDSGYFMVDVEEWWQITVEGVQAEGIAEEDYDAFAASLGFADWADLEYFVKVTQWAVIDKNGNGYGCMKRRPHTPGNPYYFFNGVDDQSSTPVG